MLVSYQGIPRNLVNMIFDSKNESGPQGFTNGLILNSRSNNKMKRERKKNLCTAQETSSTSLGLFFFCLPEGGLGPSVARLGSPGAVLGLPCAFPPSFAPPFTPIAAALRRPLASTTHPASSGSQRWCWVHVLSSVGWRWEGEGAYLAGYPISRVPRRPVSLSWA